MQAIDVIIKCSLFEKKNTNMILRNLSRNQLRVLFKAGSSLYQVSIPYKKAKSLINQFWKVGQMDKPIQNG